MAAESPHEADACARCVLILPPTKRDAQAMQKLFADAGIESAFFLNVNALCQAYRHGAGAIIISEEAMTTHGDMLATCLQDQEVWSDIPIMVLSRSGTESAALSKSLPRMGNVSVVERPVRVSTLVSLVRSSLRARERQYQVRDHILGQLYADERKDEFLATLAHELRNPLAPIRTAAALLKSESLKDEQLSKVQNIITRQVTHMSALLDDLLDVSRITRGTFLLKKELVDVRVIMEEAVEAVRSAVDAKQHGLQVQELHEPLLLEVDPVRVTQVITNLLTNAVKYTPRGGSISVGTRLMDGSVQIYVRDNGVGLTEESKKRVFDMFTRIDSELGRIEGGLGIGLALSKGLVSQHGGRLEVHSAGLNQGSEFVMTFLSQELKAPLAQEGSVFKQKTPSRQILIADDNQDAAESLGMLLEMSDHKVLLANSGLRAWEVANERRPEVGIFDIGMPDLNGYDLAQRIRRETWGKAMTLIAITGWGQDSDRRQAILSGFDFHLTKPVDPDQLEKLLADTAALPHLAPRS